MAEIVNLRRAVKQKARADRAKVAAANAAKHGRTKAERVAEATEAARQKARLDGHKKDDS